MLAFLIEKSPLPNLKYLHRYVKFIKKCESLSKSGYTERHHIIPKSLGGNNSEDNMLRLTAAQHFGAHILLAKATNSPKMIKALHKMMHSRTGDVKRDYNISSRLYEYLKERHAKIVSEYSKNTVTATCLTCGINKRIPREIFYEYKDIFY